MSNAARPQWAGQRAMSWVIDDAPVPTALFPVLMVIARRCDENGCGSYQSVPTIAEKTGKSPDQVKKDIRDLLKAGLLLPGDESLVAHFPAWSRPKVYDVPLHISGPKPTKEGRNKQGVNRQGGCMDTPGGTGTPGCMEAPGGGGTDTPGVGVRVHPKQSLLTTQENNPSLSPREDEQPPAATIPAQRTERETDPTSSSKATSNKPTGTTGILVDAGLTPDEVASFTAWADTRLQGGPKGPGWYVTANGNRTLQVRIEEWRAAGAAVASCSACDDEGEVGDYLNRRTCVCVWWKDPAKAMREFRAAAKDLPPCEHGEAGGDEEAPNGWRICPLCRGPGWVAKDLQPRTEERGSEFRPSTSAARARQGLAVADELDRKFGHGKYAARSPADQRIIDAGPLYAKYKAQETGQLFNNPDSIDAYLGDL